MGRSTAHEVVGRLRRFALARDRLHAFVCRRVGLSTQDVNALEHLEVHGGLTPGQLGDLLCLSSGAVTALADRLEAAGYLIREPHPSDRRSVVLRLTPEAHARGEAEFGAFAEDMERAARRLSKEERAAVERFLEAAAAVADRHARERGLSTVSADPAARPARPAP